MSVDNVTKAQIEAACKLSGSKIPYYHMLSNRLTVLKYMAILNNVIIPVGVAIQIMKIEG